MKKNLLFLWVALLVLQSEFTLATTPQPLFSLTTQSNFLFGEIAALRDEIKAKVKNVMPKVPYPLTASATLREHLPEHTIAYIRIPSIWGTLAAPKETLFKQALESQVLQQQMQQIEEGIHNNLLQQGQSATTLLFSVFLHHIRSPLEVASFLPEADAPPMMVNTLLTVKLDFSELDELNQVLTTLIAEEPNLEFTQPISEQGFGIINTPVFPLFLHYDLEKHLFSLLFGAMADESLLRQTLVQTPSDSPMYAIEQQIDTAYQGLFFWIDMQPLMPIFVSEMSPDDKQVFEKLGLLGMKGLGYGWGSANSKGRLKFIIDAPKAGYRQFVPTINNQLNLTTAGNPDMLVSLALPGLELLQGTEKILEQELSPEEIQKYHSFKEQVKQATGFSIEEFLQFFGPEIVFFNDTLGDFMAIQTNSTHDIDQFIAFLEKHGGQHEIRQIDGQEYHHLKLHIDIPIENPEDPTEGLVSTLLNQGNMHFYWIEESGYLIFAKVPQLLIERHAALQRVNIKQWLTQEQRQSVQNAVLLFSISMTDSPRYFYQIYLTLLNYLADIARTDIDLFALPTAQQLNLPKNGGYGVQLDVTDSQIALEVSFDNNPLEFLIGNSGTSVAVIGIMAAVAIPAYMDYLNRAKVSEALNLLGGLKTPALEFYASKGLFPTVEEMEAVTQGKYVESIIFEPPMTYTATFGVNAGNQLAEEIVSLTYDTETQMWQCITTVKQQYVNASICQSIEY